MCLSIKSATSLVGILESVMSTFNCHNNERASGLCLEVRDTRLPVSLVKMLTSELECLLNVPSHIHVHRILTKIDHILGYETSLNNYTNHFSDFSVITLTHGHREGNITP